MESKPHHPNLQLRQIVQIFQKLLVDRTSTPVAELVERVFLPEVLEHLPLMDHQDRFSLGCSTITALNIMVHKICTGFNRPKPTEQRELVALDLTAFFDNINSLVFLEYSQAFNITNSNKR